MGIEKALMKLGEGALDSLDDASFYKLLKDNMTDKAITQYGGHKAIRQMLKRGNDPLLLMHRISPDNLKKTTAYEGAGGKSFLVNPSLQAVNPKVNPGGDFGEIMLLANKDMLYPTKKRYASYEGEPDVFKKPVLFSKDAYTPRIPMFDTGDGKKWIYGTHKTFTPNNVSKYMNRKQVQAGEYTDWVSPSSYSALNARRFKDLSDADKYSPSTIRPHGEVRERIRNYNEALGGGLNNLLQNAGLTNEDGSPKSITGAHDMLWALHQGKFHPRAGAPEGYEFLDAPENRDIVKALDKMASETPTDYYEGKGERPVELGEFKKALLPNAYKSIENIPTSEMTGEEQARREALDIIRNAGLPIEYYDADKRGYGKYDGVQEALIGQVEGKDRFTTDYLLSARPNTLGIAKEAPVLNGLLPGTPSQNTTLSNLVKVAPGQASLFDYPPADRSNGIPVPPENGPSQTSIFDMPPQEATQPQPKEPVKAPNPEDDIMLGWSNKSEGHLKAPFSYFLDEFEFRSTWDDLTPQQRQDFIEKKLLPMPVNSRGNRDGLAVYKALTDLKAKRAKNLVSDPRAVEFRKQIGVYGKTEARRSRANAYGQYTRRVDNRTGRVIKGTEKITLNLKYLESVNDLNSVVLHEAQHMAWARIPNKNKRLILSDLLHKCGLEWRISRKMADSLDANELMSYSFQYKYGEEYMKKVNFETAQKHLDNLAKMVHSEKVSFRERIVNAFIAFADYMKMKIKHGIRFVSTFDDYYNQLIHGDFADDFAKDVSEYNPAYGKTDKQLEDGMERAFKKLEEYRQWQGSASVGESMRKQYASSSYGYGGRSEYGLTPIQTRFLDVADDIKRNPNIGEKLKDELLDLMGYEDFSGAPLNAIAKEPDIMPEVVGYPSNKIKFTGSGKDIKAVEPQPRDKVGRWARKDGSMRVGIDEIMPNGIWSEDYFGPENQAKVALLEQKIRFGEEVPPIAVMKTKDGRYSVLDGNHRMQAYYNAGVDPVVKVFDNRDEAYKFAQKWDDAHKNTPDQTLADFGEYGGYSSNRGFSKDVKRVGSKGVAPVDPETIPGYYNNEEGEKHFNELLNEKKWPVEIATGKNKYKITKADLTKALVDNGYEDEADLKGLSKEELWRKVDRMQQEQTLEELWDNGDSRGAEFMEKFIELGPEESWRRYGNMKDYYIDHNGSAGRFDKELSDRLGIGQSHSPMRDSISGPDSRYGFIPAGTFSPSTKAISLNNRDILGDETGVEVVGHERFHSWQDMANQRDYDPRFGEAMREFHEEAKKFYKNRAEIKALHKDNHPEYWETDIEQEARMWEAFLHRNKYVGQNGTGRSREEEFGPEVDAMFNKLLKKLQKLSKEGVALPAFITAILGGSALAPKEDKVE